MENRSMQQNLNQLIAEAQKQRVEQIIEKDIEVRVRIISQAYDRAVAYSNFIIMAGYAAAFTVWSLTKDYLPEAATIAVGLGLVVSLFTFCGWEVYKMIYTSGELRRCADVLLKNLPPEEFFKEIEKVQRRAERDKLRVHRYWIFVLVMSVPSGFGAAALLFYNFVANLIGLPYWPE